MNRRLGDRGAVVAEFAIALPAVVLVLAFGLAALTAGSTQIRLQHAAASASRILARGDSDDAVAAVLSQIGLDAQFTTVRRDGLVCVTVSAPADFGPMQLEVHAESCALDGGR